LQVLDLSLPVGDYVRFEVAPPCGLAGEEAVIGELDDPPSFYHPDHVRAGLLWFRQGFVEYAFSAPLPKGAEPVSLELSAEICSDAPGHDPDFPSDITLWINDREIGTWTSPGDFGGTRGALTPAWWSAGDSQYGQLKRWRIDAEGSWLDDQRLSDAKIGDLGIPGQSFLVVGFGVKPEAAQTGGINLFGRTFGNHPLDLALRLSYDAG